jgi:hypothetical protein
MKTKTEYKNDAAQLAEILKQEWARVEYNEKTESGKAHTSLGTVRFHESANDPAVVCTIPAITVKASAENVAELMQKIEDLVRMCGC